MSNIKEINKLQKPLFDATKSVQDISEKASNIRQANSDALISHTQPSLSAKDADTAANVFSEKAKANSDKALDAVGGGLDELRIKALLED